MQSEKLAQRLAPQLPRMERHAAMMQRPSYARNLKSNQIHARYKAQMQMHATILLHLIVDGILKHLDVMKS